MIPIIIAAILIVLALLGMPLFAVILALAMLGFVMGGIDITVVASEVYRITDTPLLVALPLFTFTGYILGGSRAPQRLMNLTQALLGWMPGGLAIVAFVSCALFTAFTGASGVTIVALGALLLPALRQAEYSESFSMGLVTSSGSLGLLLPPSLPLIIYGIIAQQMGATLGQQPAGGVALPRQAQGVAGPAAGDRSGTWIVRPSAPDSNATGPS